MTISIIETSKPRESRNIQILITKNIQDEVDEDEEDKLILQTLVSIMKLMKQWHTKKEIDGVINNNDKLVNPTTAEINEWLSDTKFTGKDKKQTYVFLTV